MAFNDCFIAEKCSRKMQIIARRKQATSMRDEDRLFECKKSQTSRTRPIDEVLTLALGEGRLSAPSVAFPRQTTMVSLVFFGKIRALAKRRSTDSYGLMYREIL